MRCGLSQIFRCHQKNYLHKLKFLQNLIGIFHEILVVFSCPFIEVFEFTDSVFKILRFPWKLLITGNNGRRIAFPSRKAKTCCNGNYRLQK